MARRPSANAAILLGAVIAILSVALAVLAPYGSWTTVILIGVGVLLMLGGWVSE